MRNVKTWGILFLCLLLLPGVAYAQKRQIEGTVISQEDKEPLIGATVIVSTYPEKRYLKRGFTTGGDEPR